MNDGKEYRAAISGYDVLAHYQTPVGSLKLKLGKVGKCRFCGETDQTKFRNISHTLAEGLGNKSLISVDECDACNNLFDLYDDSLCKSAGAVLTLGGVKGKKNKVRKTGLPGRSHQISHTKTDGRRHISFGVMNVGSTDPTLEGTALAFRENSFALKYPAPPETFVPRLAYKALVKAAVAALPEVDLPSFSRVIDWLQTPFDKENFPVLGVAFSIGSLGNAPPISAVTLLRRKEGHNGFHTIAIIFAASCCWAIDLMPDTYDNHLPPLGVAIINIKWSALIGDATDAVEIRYEHATHFNWSSAEQQPTPIKFINLSFDTKTTESRFVPEYRTQS